MSQHTEDEWDAAQSAEAAANGTVQGVEAANQVVQAVVAQAEATIPEAAAMGRNAQSALTAGPAQIRESLSVISTAGIQNSLVVFDTMKANAESLTTSIETSVAAASKGLTDFNVKLVEALRENVNSTFELAESMLGARTPLQAVAMNSDHLRRRMEAFGTQSRTLSDLAQKVATETFQPLRTGLHKAVRQY